MAIAAEMRARITAENRTKQAIGETVRELDGLTAAARRTRGALVATGTGSRSYARAGREVGTISKANAFVMRDLSFQLNDVATGLAMGVSPARILAQQGGQIVQAFQMAEGGVGGVLRSAATMAMRFAPALLGIGAAAGVVVGGIAGLTYEINKNAKVQVGWKDVVVASWQLVAENLTGAIGPAINQLGVWFGQFVDWITPAFKFVGNAIVGSMVAAYQISIVYWQKWPAALGDQVYQGANNVISGVNWMVGGTVNLINKAITALNALSNAQIKTIDFGGWGALKNPYAGAASSLTASAGAALSGAFSTDYMGQAFDAISQRSQKLALAAKGAGDAVTGAGAAAKGANDNFKGLANDGLQAANDNMQPLRDAFNGFFSDLGNGVNPINAVFNALKKLASQWLSMESNNLFTQLGSWFTGGWVAPGAGGVGGGSGGFGSYFGAYATGGSFTVPGSGGTDSVLASMHLTPGERVTVSPKGAANQNSGATVHLSTSIVVQGDGDAAKISAALDARDKAWKRELPSLIRDAQLKRRL